jgi:hypothetical protein
MERHVLEVYTDYLISQQKYATATGLSALLEGSLSHDKITRLLSQEDYGSKELWSYVKPLVRSQETLDMGVLSFDDTIEEKPYTDENELVCWHFCHTHNRNVKGINLLTALVSYGEVSIPVGYELVKKNRAYCDIKTRQEKRMSCVTKNEQFRGLFKQCVENKLKFAYTLADSWFACVENMKYIHEAGRYFIFALKSNRLVALTPEAKQSAQYENISSLAFKEGESLVCYLKDYKYPVSICKKVFTNEDGSQGILYLVTNDLTLSAERMVEIYQKRWKIEVYHKSIKQNASLAKSPTRTVRTQSNHVFCSLIGYCKLEALKIKTHLNHFAIRHKLLLKANLVSMQELKSMQQSAGLIMA